MEFIARTVEHPNGRISKEIAEGQLKRHPQFVPGTLIVGMEHRAGKWVATLHEPKVASPPPFATDDADSPAGDSEPKDDAPKSDDSDKDKKTDSDNKDDDTGEKISIEKVFDLVKQVAQAVGVAPDGPSSPDGSEGLGDELGGPEGLDGPPPPPHGGPEGGPPHDETSAVPGSPDTKQIIHRKAPPGAVPVGAPAFASTRQAAPKVATFDVEEVVANDMPLHVAKDEIESMYSPHGYRVRNIAEGRDEQGRRTIRARVSVR